MKSSRACRGSYLQGHFSKVSDPNGEVLCRNPGDLAVAAVSFPFSYEHVNDAVMAAKRGFSSWKRIRPSERLTAISRYSELLRNRMREVAEAISYEVGKPLWEAQWEVSDCLSLLSYLVEKGSQTTVEVKVPDVAEESQGVIRFFSRGVFVVISPATQPLLIAHSHFIPALIHGNSVVLKSSKTAPLTGQLIAEMAHDAGLPSGVVNVIHGDGEVARRLSCHQDVDGVFFTGPFEAGFKIKKQTLSDYWKIVILDMGGKNGLVVWDDCEYKKALHEGLFAAFVTAGQRCTSASRILVHQKVFDRFLEDFHGLAKKLRVGCGLANGVDAPFMGPLVSEGVMENYLRYQGIAVREGCDEIMRGKTLEREKKGYYVSPSIHVVAEPDPKSVYQKNEIFGPNVAFYRVRDLDEVADILNQTQYGLVSSIYTSARENYVHLLEEARVGMLHWNRPTTDVSYKLPYGGIKKSGNSRPMGYYAGEQCTYPLSSLESTKKFDAAKLPKELPRLE